jgi:hypothetical protein
MPALARKRHGLALNDFETFAPLLFLHLITPQYCKCKESKEGKQGRKARKESNSSREPPQEFKEEECH